MNSFKTLQLKEVAIIDYRSVYCVAFDPIGFGVSKVEKSILHYLIINKS